MRKRNGKVFLLLLLALLFSAHTLTAQTGWQFFTVEGTPGGSGTLTLQFDDNSFNTPSPNPPYYATYNYGPSDTQATAAAGLTQWLNNGYGWSNTLTATCNGSTFAVAFTPYMIHTVGNGYFYDVYPPFNQTNTSQSMYVVNNGFDFPTPQTTTTTNSPTPGVTVTVSADGTMTIGATPAPDLVDGVSIVGTPTITDNTNGSTSVTTNYSDGTTTTVTFPDPAAAAAETYANMAEAYEQAAANQATSPAQAQADANASYGMFINADAVAEANSGDQAVQAAAAEAAQAADEAQNAAEDAAGVNNLNNNNNDPSAPDSGDSGGGCGASCGSGGNWWEPCGDSD